MSKFTVPEGEIAVEHVEGSIATFSRLSNVQKIFPSLAEAGEVVFSGTGVYSAARLCYNLEVKGFFSRNLDNRGRLLRGVGGGLLVLGGIIACQTSTWLGTGLILAGGFMLFEAVRGWCVMRACGIKTRL